MLYVLVQDKFAPSPVAPPSSSHLTIASPESVLTSTMSSTTVRQRGQKDKKQPASPSSSSKTESDLNGILKDTNLPEAVTSEWDYKLALGLITLLAFITRFWGIGHPNEVVFDEVHFGKVRRSTSFTQGLSTASTHTKPPCCRRWAKPADYAHW